MSAKILRDWCCRTPLDGPHAPGCGSDPTPDNGPDYAELFKDAPGPLWVIPDFTWPPPPVTAEIPIPDWFEDIAQCWDAIGLSGLDFGDVVRNLAHHLRRNHASAPRPHRHHRCRRRSRVLRRCPVTGRILVAWTMTDRADRLWEVTRHENGRPILVGSYVSREFAWGTMDADRAFHLEDPRYFELQSPGGQKRIKRSDMDGLAPTWMKILAIALICVAVGLFVCLLWRSFENDKRCAAAIGPGSTFYANDLCSPPPVHVDGLFLG